MAPQMLLFAEVDGAARLLERVGDRARLGLLLRKYGQLAHDAISRHSGQLLSERETELLCRFDEPVRALGAAAELQQSMARESWPFGVNLRVRIALHASELAREAASPAALDLHRIERIAGLAHGGQVLLSHPARVRVAGAVLPPGHVLREIGPRHLPGLHYSERLTELAPSAAQAGALRALSDVDDRADAEAGLIGRGALLDTLASSLRRDEQRLLTLTGAPGTGRTRLARALAARLRHDYPEGVYFIAPSVLFEPAQLAAALLRALGLFEVALRTAVESLVEHLASPRALIVVDGISPGARPLIAELLANCAQLKVIAVGPSPLGLPPEHAVAVPGLSLPAAAPPGASLPEGEALQLFVERVRASRPGFELNRNNAAAIADGCTLLAGAPLAIELAAASARTGEPAEITGRLAELLSGSGALAEPQSAEVRALRAAAQVRYERLDAEAQALLRRSAAFTGAIALDANDARLSWLGEDRDRVRAGLEALAEARLLARESVLGERRLRMPEGLRAFALDIGAQDEREAAGRAHAGAFAAFAESHAKTVLGAEQRPAVEALVAESDNLHGALRTAIDQRDFAVAARLVHALLWFWLSRSWLSDGHACVRRALAADPPPGRDHALLLAASGWLSLFRGDFPAAIAALTTAASEFDRAPDAVEAARCRTGVGLAHITVGEAQEGQARLSAALTRGRELRDPGTSAFALVGLGNDARARAEWAQSEAHYREARTLFAAAGNVFSVGVVLHHMARLRLRVGDPAGAARLLAEALEFGREYDYPSLLHLYLAAMGELAVARSQPALGARLFGAVTTSMQLTGVCMERAEERDMERGVAQARGTLGDIAFETAFAQGSHWTLEEAIAAAQKIG